MSEKPKASKPGRRPTIAKLDLFKGGPIPVPTPIKADDPKFIPQYATDGSAAADLVANVPPDPIGNRVVTIAPNRCEVVDVGFSMALPKGFKAEISLRSGHGKAMLLVPNAPGLIDEDYRGRVKVLIANVGKHGIEIKDGERFAQMKLEPVWRFDWQPVEHLDDTARGTGGFGSTGKTLTP